MIPCQVEKILIKQRVTLRFRALALCAATLGRAHTMAMPTETNLTHFLPSGDKARGAPSAPVRLVAVGAGAVGTTEFANGGEFQTNGVDTMTQTVVELSPLALATVELVKASGKVEGASTSYLALALADVRNADKRDDVAASLIADLCQTAKVVSAKGKANPQALKSAGHGALAEVARLTRKVAKLYADNDGVALAVDGFLGIVADETHFNADRNAFPAIVKAVESGDEKKLEKAEAAYRDGYLNRMYPERPTSFSALRRAIDAASKPVGKDADETATETETGDGDVSDNAVAVVAADVIASADIDALATALIAKLPDASDATVESLLAAIREEVSRRLATDVSQAA